MKLGHITSLKFTVIIASLNNICHVYIFHHARSLALLDFVNRPSVIMCAIRRFAKHLFSETVHAVMQFAFFKVAIHHIPDHF